MTSFVDYLAMYGVFHTMCGVLGKIIMDCLDDKKVDDYIEKYSTGEGKGAETDVDAWLNAIKFGTVALLATLVLLFTLKAGDKHEE
jgi:hypothetical protein